MASITAGDLEISYDEQGSADRGVVLLLRGWPDDASTWNGVAPALAATGRRTIMPTLRGFGDTRFSPGTAPRTGNSGILAMDAIALMDALRVERFSVVGHDWGSHLADHLA